MRAPLFGWGAFFFWSEEQGTGNSEVRNIKFDSLIRQRKILLIASAITALVLVFSQCVDRPKKKVVAAGGDVRGPEYIGDEACGSCHGNIDKSYHFTAHHTTSAAPSIYSIKGSFDTSKNTYHYLDNVKVRMENRDSGLYQVAYMNDKERGAFPFGTVIGSGRKAQTYLYWYGENVFQLPISYSVAAGSWVNSPNYPPDKVRFDRLINAGCFECHGSYIKLKGTQEEGDRLVDYFDRRQVIYGIDCERCHGPAKQHVNFHADNPQEKKAQFIASFASLPRQARIDLCAQCHSGAHPVKKSTFFFKPGDTLTSYFARAANDHFNVSELDVHGNQYQLMAASACFKKSDMLDCASCHNPHVGEKDLMETFSSRCMNCHQNVKHSFTAANPSLQKEIVKNCIDCHMPAAPSRAIGMKAENEAEAAPNLVRTHYVAVYGEMTQRYIDSLKKRR